MFKINLDHTQIFNIKIFPDHVKICVLLKYLKSKKKSNKKNVVGHNDDNNNNR